MNTYHQSEEFFKPTQTTSFQLNAKQSFNCLTSFFSTKTNENTTHHLITTTNNNNSSSDVKNLTDDRTNQSSLMKIKNIFNANLFKAETQLSRELNATNSNSLPSSSSAFIDPTELKRIFDSSMSKLSNFFIILLDCRTYNEFSSKHIRDSVHLNCRDKLTKKRLQTRKLTVKDLISCEEIKSKFDYDLNDKLAYQVKKEELTDDSNNIIVIYDNTTSDFNDLQSDANPLKIVQDNIKQSGFQNECKILKGGFEKFSKLCPEFCVLKEANISNSLKCNREQSDFLNDISQSDIENAIMTQILPFLYLGNELDAKNVNNLAQNEIYYVLNVTKNIPFYETTNKKFKLKRIAVNDNGTQNLKDYFEEAVDFIDEAKKSGSKVLVHCQAGISRSPTIIIAYLMKKQNLKFNDAYNKVRELRPIIAPNLVFMSQLMDYETRLLNNNNNDSNEESSDSCGSSLSSPILLSSSSSSSCTSSPSNSDTHESTFFTKSNNSLNTILLCNV